MGIGDPQKSPSPLHLWYKGVMSFLNRCTTQTKDEESTRYEGIHVWQIDSHQHGTCFAGDVISPDDDYISSKVSFVFAPVKNNTIQTPKDAKNVKEVKIYHGSIFSTYIFWELIPESAGYTCPGLAVTRKGRTPDLKKYCCFADRFIAYPYHLQLGSATSKNAFISLLGLWNKKSKF